MTKKYSIAEARDQFAALVHRVEAHAHIEITRRGKVVAILLSQDEFQRLSGGKKDFWQGVSEFRGRYDLAELDISPEIFLVRSAETGREVDL